MSGNSPSAITDVCNLVVQKYSDDTIAFTAKYATSIRLGIETTETEIRGGIGNAVLMSYGGEETGTLEIDLPLLDMGVASVQTGSPILDTGLTVPAFQTLDLTTATVTIAYTPLGTSLKVQVVDPKTQAVIADLVAGATPSATEYVLTGLDIEVDATYVGKQLITVYTYTAPVGTRGMNVSSNTAPGIYTVSGIGRRRMLNGENKVVAFKINRFQPSKTSELLFANGDNTNVSFSGEILADISQSNTFYTYYELPTDFVI